MRFVAREESVVGVRARRSRVIVAGAEMDVATQHATFAPDHHAHLRVRLVAHHAVNDLCAGRLQLVGQFDVRLLVESRAQFDHHQHVFARVCRIHQRFRYGRIETGAVQRLPDRQHVGIGRRLPQKVDDRRERLKRMVQQQIAFADHVEQILVLLEPLRHSGDEPRKFEVGTVDQIGQRRQTIQVHRAAAQIDVVFGEAELGHQRRADVGRRVVRDFETHLVAEPARRQLALERAQQIVDLFFVDEQVAVARDSELIAAGDFHAGEQVADVGVHDRRQKHEVVRRLRDRRRQPHQSRQRARRLHHRFAAGAAECIFAFERHDEAQALVQHLRKRVRGIESHRAQDRHEVVREIVTQPLRLLLVPAIARNEADAFGIEPRQKQLVQHAILFVEQFVRHLRDGPQLIGRR